MCYKRPTPKKARDKVIVALKDCFKDALLREEDKHTECYYLRRIIALTPNLEAVITAGEDDRIDRFSTEQCLSPTFMPRIYEPLKKALSSLKGGMLDAYTDLSGLGKTYRGYGMITSGCNRSLLLALCAARAPVKLFFLNFDFRGLAGHQKILEISADMALALRNVRELVLESEFSRTFFPYQFKLSNIGLMLFEMRSLELLYMDFLPLRRGCGIRDDSLSGQVTSAFDHVFPNRAQASPLLGTKKLRDLQLHNLLCFEDDLYMIVGQNAHSLRNVQLGNLVLLPKIVESPKPCLVRVLRFLQSELELYDVGFHAIFSNSGNQNWFFAPELSPYVPGSRTTYDDTRHFILQHGRTSLELEAVPDGKHDVEPEGDQIYGDHTCTISHAPRRFARAARDQRRDSISDSDQDSLTSDDDSLPEQDDSADENEYTDTNGETEHEHPFDSDSDVAQNAATNGSDTETIPSKGLPRDPFKWLCGPYYTALTWWENTHEARKTLYVDDLMRMVRDLIDTATTGNEETLC